MRAMKVIVVAAQCFTNLLMILCLGEQNHLCNSEGDVRLSGGTEFAGRVEVCANGTWGTICDRGWDYSDAEAVCKDLNFSFSSLKPISAACGSACFGEGRGEVHFKDVDCPMDAQSLANCTHDSVGSGNCSDHTRDAGVICAWPVIIPALPVTTLRSMDSGTDASTDAGTDAGTDVGTDNTERTDTLVLVGGVLGTLAGVLCLLSGCVIACWIATTCKWKHERQPSPDINDEEMDNTYAELQNLNTEVLAP